MAQAQTNLNETDSQVSGDNADSQPKKKKIIKKIIKKKKKDGTVVSSTVSTVAYNPNDSKNIPKTETYNTEFDFYETSISNPIYSSKQKKTDNRIINNNNNSNIENRINMMDSPDIHTEYDANIIIDPNKDVDHRIADKNEWISQTLDHLDTDRQIKIRLYHESISDVEHKYNSEDIIQSNENYNNVEQNTLGRRLWNNITGETSNAEIQRTELTHDMRESMHESRLDMNSMEYIQSQISEQNQKFKDWKKKNPGGLFDANSRDSWMKKLNAQRMKNKKEDSEYVENIDNNESNENSENGENRHNRFQEFSEFYQQTMARNMNNFENEKINDGQSYTDSRNQNQKKHKNGKRAERAERAEWDESFGDFKNARYNYGKSSSRHSQFSGDEHRGRSNNNNNNNNNNNETEYEFEYEMPHQTLHTGLESDDRERDLPLNTYWHKATVAADNWNIMKNKFRDNMKPGSPTWNETAFRSETERRQLSYWPQSLQTWFLRSEEELLNSHEFRCKMMDHSALEEYWRLGELRWNRKLWFPYIRLFQWSVVPIIGIVSYYRLTHMDGSPAKNTTDDWKYEYDRWKYMMKTGDADEYYMLSYNQSKLKDPPRRQTPQALSVESLESIHKRTITGQYQTLVKQKYKGNNNDPY